MSDKPNGLVYAGPNQQRFFWIPTGYQPQPGPVVVRSLTGRKLMMSQAEADQLQIPEQQAKALVEQQLKGLGQTAAKVVSSVGHHMRQAAGAQPTPQPSGDAGPTLMADTLGVTPEQLRNDPKAVLAGLQTFLQGVVTSAKQAASDNPADQAEVTARMEHLAALVERETGSDQATQAIADLPKAIADLLVSPELLGGLDKLTADLNQATADLQETMHQHDSNAPDGS